MSSAHTLMALRAQANAATDPYVRSQLWYEHTMMVLHNKIANAEKLAISNVNRISREHWAKEALRLKEELLWVSPPQQRPVVVPMSLLDQFIIVTLALAATVALLRFCWWVSH